MNRPTPASIARRRSSAHSFGRSLMLFTWGLAAVSALTVTVTLADSGCPPINYGMATAWGGHGSQVYYDLLRFLLCHVVGRLAGSGVRSTRPRRTTP